MRELLVLNICACLGYSVVALLVSWVAEECVETPVTKLLGLRIKASQLGVAPQPANQLTAVPLVTSELAEKGLPVSLVR